MGSYCYTVNLICCLVNTVMSIFYVIWFRLVCHVKVLAVNGVVVFYSEESALCKVHKKLFRTSLGQSWTVWLCIT